MPTRQQFNDRYQPYWDAPTARIGLHRYYRSLTGDTRECVVCETEKNIEEFWDGFKYSYACHDDRGKLRNNRRRLERKVAKENREMTKKNPISRAAGGVKDKVTGGAKGMIAKPASKTAGSTVKKAASNLVGDELAEQAGKLAEQGVQKALAS